MSRFKKLSHTICECKYHMVICPKYRHRIFTGQIGEYAKQQIYILSKQKDLVEVIELNVQQDPYSPCDVDAAEICDIGGHGISEREAIAVVDYISSHPNSVV